MHGGCYCRIIRYWFITGKIIIFISHKNIWINMHNAYMTHILGILHVGIKECVANGENTEIKPTDTTEIETLGDIL